MKKKVLISVLSTIMALSLVACGPSDDVVKKINEIGTVTLDSEESIVAAEEAYAELSDSDKEKVDNYSTLVSAREVYDDLLSQKMMETAYNDGLEALDAEDFDLAVECFTKADGFEDASELLEQAKAGQYYEEALEALDAEDFDLAVECFTKADGYEDSDELLEQAKAGQHYKKALEFMEEKEYSDAISELKEATAYTDTKDLISECTKEWYANLSVGDIIPFGSYECRVLDVQEGKALLITNQIVDYQGFYLIKGDAEHPNSTTTASNTTWAECTLRQYLNDQFYNTFSEDDKALILLTHVVTPDNDPSNYYAAEGGDDTDDYIFCLSMDEAYNYFDGLEDRKADFAPGVDGLNAWWWLRTPGKGRAMFNGAKTYYFTFVDENGEVQEYGNGIEYELGVRPAFWISTEAS